MAYTSPIVIGSFFFFLIISLGMQMVVGRNIPTNTKMQPEFLGHFDGSVLIPGIGRYMVPQKGVKSLHYNPITGAPGGNGVSIPGFGGYTGGAGGGSYIPGGDDTFLPNPGVEVPNPVGGGVPAQPHP